MNLIEALAHNRPIKNSDMEHYYRFSKDAKVSIEEVLREDWDVKPTFLLASKRDLRVCLEDSFITWVMRDHGFSDAIIDRFFVECDVSRDRVSFTEEQAHKIVLSVMGNKADSLSGSSEKFIDMLKDLQ